MTRKRFFLLREECDTEDHELGLLGSRKIIQGVFTELKEFDIDERQFLEEYFEAQSRNVQFNPNEFLPYDMPPEKIKRLSKVPDYTPSRIDRPERINNRNARKEFEKWSNLYLRGKGAAMEEQYPEAEKLFEQASEQGKKVASNGSTLKMLYPELIQDMQARSLQKLGSAYMRSGKKDKARTCLEQGFRIYIYQKHMAPLSLFVDLVTDLSQIYDEAHEHQADIDMCQEALQWLSLKAGSRHPMLLRCMLLLAQAHESMGNLDTPESIYREIVQVHQLAFGKGSLPATTAESYLDDFLEDKCFGVCPCTTNSAISKKIELSATTVVQPLQLSLFSQT
jgi:tetratricopeptide (TPR) repeat protein